MKVEVSGPRVVVAVLVLFIALCVTGGLVGAGVGKDYQREAVRMGAAEWVVVDDEGHTEFRWTTESPVQYEEGVIYLGENESMTEIMVDTTIAWNDGLGTDELIWDGSPAKINPTGSITIDTLIPAQPHPVFNIWEGHEGDTLQFEQVDGSVDLVFRPGTWYGLDSASVESVGRFFLLYEGEQPVQVELWQKKVYMEVDGERVYL